MEVEIISRETLKPSLPTPEHLRTYKLCLFDQLAPPVYVPISLFYSAGDGNHPGKSSDHLKDSLSKILTHYYPFAGRLNDDGLTVDCNDDGAVFVEARVSCELSFVVDEPENEVLERLLPLNPRLHQAQLSAGGGNPVMLGVQVNYFACGGVAIGVCISHVIADGAAAAGFLKAWSRFACGSTDTIETESVVYDCGSRFPPQDLSEFYRVTNPIDEKIYVSLSPKDMVSNRFCFDGRKITAIRNEIRDNSSQYNSTRVESVIALIWEALIAASSTTTKNAEPLQPPITVIGNSVNLRHRMNPPLPQQCIGNVSFLVIVSSFDDKTKNRSSLAKRIRRSVKERDEECKREITYMGTGEWLNDFMNQVCGEFERDSNMGAFFFASWCRFLFYEVDFGWGKPVWVEGGLKMNRTAIFVDSSDGEGIEAWITLSREEMEKLEQQQGILTYSTFKPSV
ncbi:hypothetical protein like AT3G26040 [Hibiscus trionum]|uniref:Uncharacterized protein n=1 Tax=Hibiscus trionum TaxID=183268 RepID=A0A9W7IE58_HIBTR|nr:hypothetical protein like AT3G26040 [Hibiscus trionum]